MMRSPLPSKLVALQLETLEERCVPSSTELAYELLEGRTGYSNRPQTVVYRIDLSQVTAPTIQSITVKDGNSHRGWAGILRGFDLDAIKLSTVRVDTATEVNDLPPIDIFDFSPSGSLFTPGGKDGATEDLFGSSNGILDNSTATPQSFDAVDVFSGIPVNGLISLGDSGQISFNLTAPLSPSGLFLYVGEVGSNEAGSFMAATEPVRRLPTIIVPGILGSLLPTMTGTVSGTFNLIRKQLTSFLLRGNPTGRVITRPFAPHELVAEQVNHTYDTVLTTFRERGYQQDIDLFFAAYDWRLPILLNPSKPTELLWDDDSALESTVEYIDWWAGAAQQKWEERYGSTDGFAVNFVAHSMGGLAVRSYIEEAAEAGQAAVPVANLIMLGTPNHGAVDTYKFWKARVRFPEDSLLNSDTWIRRSIRAALTARPKATVDTLIPSLRDLLPTFPFLLTAGGTTPVLVAGNYLLPRLNADLDDLTHAAKTTLIGSATLFTSGQAILALERPRPNAPRVLTLRFVTEANGDGRVVYDRITGVDAEAGLLLQDDNIARLSIDDVAHDDLPKKAIDAIFSALTNF